MDFNREPPPDPQNHSYLNKLWAHPTFSVGFGGTRKVTNFLSGLNPLATYEIGQINGLKDFYREYFMWMIEHEVARAYAFLQMKNFFDALIVGEKMPIPKSILKITLENAREAFLLSGKSGTEIEFIENESRRISREYELSLERNSTFIGGPKSGSPANVDGSSTFEFPFAPGRSSSSSSSSSSRKVNDSSNTKSGFSSEVEVDEDPEVEYNWGITLGKVHANEDKERVQFLKTLNLKQRNFIARARNEEIATSNKLENDFKRSKQSDFRMINFSKEYSRVKEKFIRENQTPAERLFGYSPLVRLFKLFADKIFPDEVSSVGKDFANDINNFKFSS